MTDNGEREDFLTRWSRLKRQSELAEPSPAAPQLSDAPTRTLAPAIVTPQPAIASEPPAVEDLPPIESLSFESDFKAFMQAKIPEALRRAAVKRLFQDPHFNHMDGLDVYIEDYSQYQPLTEEVTKTLAQARYIFDPPKNEWVERNDEQRAADVPMVKETEEMRQAANELQPSSTDQEPGASLDDQASNEQEPSAETNSPRES